MRATWAYTRRLPRSWGLNITMSCPSPPVQRVPISSMLESFKSFPDTRRATYPHTFVARSARVLGLDGGRGRLTLLGQVWHRLHQEGVSIGDPDCPAARYLLAATALARDGLPLLALLTSCTDQYRSAEEISILMARRIQAVLDRGSLVRRANLTIEKMLKSDRPIRKLRWRMGLLEDLGLAKARSYCGGFKLTPEGVRLSKEADLILQFGPPHQINRLHLEKSCWLARVDSVMAEWEPEGIFPPAEQSLYAACLRVRRGKPGTSWAHGVRSKK